jgi:oligo-1,6-glucosidase
VPWIGVNTNHKRINAESQRGVPGSIFEFYRDLIALRHANPVVVDGAFEIVLPEHPVLFAFTRSLGSESILVAANLSSGPIAFELPEGLPVIANYQDAAAGELRPWEARVLRLPSRLT